MLPSLLIGLVSGLRSLTPIAVVSLAAHHRGPEPGDPAADLLAWTPATAALSALAVGEVAGDKWSKAPDRIVAPGIAARLLTGGLAGAALAPRGAQIAGSALGAAGAVVGAYAGFALRMRAIDRWGQVSTGFVEDALALGAALAVVNESRLRPR